MNATNESMIVLDSTNLSLVDNGIWSIHYQKRVIDSSKWVDELIDSSMIQIDSSSDSFLPAPSLLIQLISLVSAAFVSRRKNTNNSEL